MTGVLSEQRSAQIPSRIIATCFALVSFAAALIVGVAAGNQAVTILWRALVIMIIGWGVGRVIGAIAQRTVDDHIEEYKNRNPISGKTGMESADAEEGATVTNGEVGRSSAAREAA